jgi:hypothetical protein
MLQKEIYREVEDEEEEVGSYSMILGEENILAIDIRSNRSNSVEN